MPQSMSLRNLKREIALKPVAGLQRKQEVEGPPTKSLSSQAKPSPGSKTNPTPGSFQEAPPEIVGDTDQGGESKDAMELLAFAAEVAAAAKCWCAALYYPLGSKDWWDCRNWILQGWTSPVGKGFAYFYKRYGLSWSEYLTAHPKLMAAVKPFFVWANRRGKDM